MILPTGRKILSLVLLVLAVFFCQSGMANAEVKFSASIREEFTSMYRFSYSSDSMYRVRRELSDLGFNVFTISIRLGVENEEDSQVYAAQFKSKRHEIEAFIAAVLQGRGEVSIRPIIGKSPGLGVIDRLPNLRPKNPELFFTTYGQALSVYASIAEKREISEIILGVGLDYLWDAKYSKYWLALATDLRRRAGEKTRFSIELTGEKSLQALAKWKNNDPSGFQEFFSQIARIRIHSSAQEKTPGMGDWDKEITKNTIQTNLLLVKNIFPAFSYPNLQYVLSNITAPACPGFNSVEEERFCPSGFVLNKQYQANAYQAWLDAYALLPAELKSQIAEIDFLASTTNAEPEKITGVHAKYFLFNEQAKKVFISGLKKIENSTAASSAPYSEQNHGRANPSQPVFSPDIMYARANTNKKLACIFYEDEHAQDYVGAIHARMLENLLGAFPAWQPIRLNIVNYRARDIEACESAFYLGTNFNVEVPKSFLADAVPFSAKYSLVWMNYKFPNFTEVFNAIAKKNGTKPFPFQANSIAQSIDIPSPQIPDPGFFRYFEYKGEVFEKRSNWDPISNRFASSPELNIIEILDPTAVDTLAQAKHSRQRDLRTPYAVRQKQSKGGVWYIADTPFSFVHYEDRYFIFCDLLWDILGEKAPEGPKAALVRLEDINPIQEQKDLIWVIDYLASQKIPFSMAVIPYYSNTFGTGLDNPKPVWKPINEFPEFVGTLRYARARGANFIMHGMAHQAGDLISGYDGTSGSDYEFWMYPENRPLPFDSSDYVLDRLEKAEAVFNRLGLKAMAWEVPHYAASSMNSILFGKLFEWNYHRSLYFKGELLNDVNLEPRLRLFNCKDAKCRKERAELLREVRVSTDYSQFGGQILPFRVFKDSYGQAIIPETLGMVDYMFYNDNTWRPVGSPDTVLRYAKKLRVVRGAMASFFWHPDVMNPNLDYYARHPGHYDTVGGKNTLIKIVEGLKEMGYVFRSIADCDLFPRAECQR